DEDVAASRLVADEARLVRTVAERQTKLAHQDLDVLGLHVGVGPDVIEDGLLRHDRAGAFEQTSQDIRGLSCHRDFSRATPQHAVALVEAKRREILYSIQPARADGAE